MCFSDLDLWRFAFGGTESPEATPTSFVADNRWASSGGLVAFEKTLSAKENLTSKRPRWHNQRGLYLSLDHIGRQCYAVFVQFQSVFINLFLKNYEQLRQSNFRNYRFNSDRHRSLFSRQIQPAGGDNSSGRTNTASSDWAN